LKKYPKEDWKPGDAVITNDPWIGTGHRPDFTIAAPIFARDKLVAFAGTVAHASDIGGIIIGADSKDVFEEGLGVPIMKILRGGKINTDLIDIIRANVRLPEQVMGDLYAQLIALEKMAESLLELIEEYDLKDLTSIATVTQNLAERAMRNAILKIPQGVYPAAIETDGYDEPFIIKTTITVKNSEITVDYAGTSQQTDQCAVNSPMCYTYAYTAYSIKCAIDPETPRNDGSYRPITVVAPEGTIVNASFPAAVNARHLTGNYVATPIYKALSQVIPEKVIADSGGTPNLRGRFSGTDNKGRIFVFPLRGAGGMGARPDRDGLPCTGFPSNSIFGSLEVSENVAPIIFWHKEMEPDSGGPGRFRGGCGQRVVIQLVSEHPATVSFRAERTQHPASGLFGGLPGNKTKLTVYKGQPGQPVDVHEQNGREIDPKGRTRLMPGDVLEVVYPGGGGYGLSTDRAKKVVHNDLKNELISYKAAKAIYKI
jgi:N-methylhydantoinase B